MSLDTSALAKLFIAEPGSDLAATAVGLPLAVVTHRIADVEMPATLARAERMGRVKITSLDHRSRELKIRLDYPARSARHLLGL